MKYPIEPASEPPAEHPFDVFQRGFERTRAFRSLLRLSPIGHRDEHWRARLTAELWVMRCDARGELGKPIDPTGARPAPEKPSATTRKLTAYLRSLKALEKQAKALGGRASTRATQHLTALRAIALLAASELELYQLRMRERRGQLGSREARGANEDPLTPQLKRLSGLLEWVPGSKRWVCVSELYAFATERTPIRPEQIRLRLKETERGQKSQDR